MATERIQLSYESVDPNVHTMDVEQLGPSLIALGTLCKRANALINGERARVRVLVEADFQHKCFQVTLRVVQDVIEQTVAILQMYDIKTSKEILALLGLAETSLGGYGLIQYLKAKKGQKPTSVKVSDKDGSVELLFDAGRNNTFGPIHLTQHVWQLANDRAVIAAVKGLLQPTQTPAIDAVEFKDHNGHTVTEVKRAEAEQIIVHESVDTPIDPNALPPQVIDARLTIYSPVFASTSKTWKFIYSDHVVSVDISDSGIAEDVIRRGAVSIGDAYLVKLEITESKTAKGYKNTYRALSISEFLPATPQSTQLALRLKDEEGD